VEIRDQCGYVSTTIAKNIECIASIGQHEDLDSGNFGEGDFKWCGGAFGILDNQNSSCHEHRLEKKAVAYSVNCNEVARRGRLRL